MKKKFFVVAAALSLICVTSTFAQDPQAPATPPTPPTPPTPEQMAQAKAERLTQRLNLTDDQARKVYDVCLEQAKEQQALFEKMAALRNEQAEKMKSILTTEQFVQWAQVQAPEGMVGPRDRHPRRSDACMNPKDGPKKGIPEGKAEDQPRKERATRE